MALLENVDFVQGLCLAGIYVGTVVSCLLPMHILRSERERRRHSSCVEHNHNNVSSQDVSSAMSARSISFMNCISGGVFLATCFLGLIPYVRELFVSAFQKVEFETGLPVTEATILFGFFLILFVEQLVTKWRDNKNQKNINVEKQKSCRSRPIPIDRQKEGSITDEESKNIQNGPVIIRREDLETQEQFSDGGISSSNETRTPRILLRPPDGNKDRRFKTYSCSSESEVPDEQSSLTGVTKRMPQESCVVEHHTDHCSHGHSHLGDLMGQERNLRFFVLVLALSIHSIFEGLALGLQTQLSKVLNLFIAIMIHECLVAFALGVSLARLNIKNFTFIKFTLVYCLLIPFGILLGIGVRSLPASPAGDITSAILQGLAAGTFIHVTFLEIVPSEMNVPTDRLLKVLFFVVGTVIVVIIIVATNHLH